MTNYPGYLIKCWRRFVRKMIKKKVKPFPSAPIPTMLCGWVPQSPQGCCRGTPVEAAVATPTAAGPWHQAVQMSGWADEHGGEGNGPLYVGNLPTDGHAWEGPGGHDLQVGPHLQDWAQESAWPHALSLRALWGPLRCWGCHLWKERLWQWPMSPSCGVPQDLWRSGWVAL